jgi:TPP-dependent pyruvate/acetoin dehydrogenase alpha subunit
VSEPGAAPTETPRGSRLDPDLESLYAAMLRIRLFEDAVHLLFLRNEIEGTTHLCQGQEAVNVGVCDVLEPGDTVAATYRGHGACLARGADPVRLFAELLGRETGLNGGRGGSMNVVDLEHGVLGCFGIVGGSIGAGTGAALAAQLRCDGTAAVSFFGDGAVNQAYFHECLNFASVRRLPIVYACENNLYGEWTAMERVTGGGQILPRAAGYGIPGTQVDGNDVLVVRDAAAEALTRARAGEGPTLIEFLTYRHKGHSRVDPGKYRPREEVEAWLARDPLPRLAGRLDPDSVERIGLEVEREIESALKEARAAPYPDPGRPASATKEAR